MQYREASNHVERRLAAIGHTRGRRLLFVVHIEFENGIIRIISARPAEKPEEKLYEKFA